MLKVLPIFMALLLLGTAIETKGTKGILGFRWSVSSHCITYIHPGSPLEGICEVGDKIVAIDGIKGSSRTLGNPGESIHLTIKRKGLDKLLEVYVRRIAVQDLHSRALNQYWGVEDEDSKP